MTTEREQGWTTGAYLHGELASADASAGLLIPLYDDTGRQTFIGPRDQMGLSVLAVTTAGGDCYYYADILSGTGVAAASTGDDTLTVVGDVARFLKVGDTFTVYGSTGNDAEYTITSIAFSSVTGQTLIGVDTVANGTADGTLAWTYFNITGADATGNTLDVPGDQLAMFPVGRTFRVNGSTGNDNAGANYTVTGAAFVEDSSGVRSRGVTRISVASVASGVADGRIIPQSYDAVGRRYLAGDYAVKGGRERDYAERVVLPKGYQLFGVAAAGNVDFEVLAFLLQFIDYSRS